ncbi:hypothetical protein [Candidatus Symbiopectobacterium endolongispinus]|uniref:hypothetical protein n=1 Tax=Candidatus Symbiopectobacterium endolongispinus TaxID=2812664 RepID=UPI002079FB3D|nr:hypothetical protein [Candidatus Symbiopectobacterium endolongispinus]MBT9430534.1 hypothetical protein [Candidatus Symbiopectobacterium endolongispinus]MBT9430555.1 hypothetical protein [Candidatus Symbiopectobacterium endolongispinus]
MCDFGAVFAPGCYMVSLSRRLTVSTMIVKLEWLAVAQHTKSSGIILAYCAGNPNRW